MKTKIEQELDRAIEEVKRTFDALSKANIRLARCKKPESIEAARREVERAAAEYRAASDKRDELCELRNAILTQRGDERGALWSRPDGVSAPALPASKIRQAIRTVVDALPPIDEKVDREVEVAIGRFMAKQPTRKLKRNPDPELALEKFLDPIKDEIDQIGDLPVSACRAAARDLIEYIELHYLHRSEK